MNLIKTFNLDNSKEEIINEMQYILFLASINTETNMNENIKLVEKIANLNINSAAIINKDNQNEVLTIINENYSNLNKLIRLKNVKKVVANNQKQYEQWLIHFLKEELLNKE